MRFVFLIAGALLLAACPPPPPTPDAGQDGGAVALEHCLDAPDTVVRRPSGELPCELLPPGFRVER